MNYYRRYVGDYLRDTARLSVLEHGAYNLLLDHYYAEELPIPLDMVEVYTMVRAMTPADRKAVEKVLKRYFTKKPDGYHNARADHEIAVSQTARGNGAKGGRPATGTVTGLITGPETGIGTTEGGGTGHPPTTNHQPPSASLQPPASQPPASKPRKVKTITRAPAKNAGPRDLDGSTQGNGIETWTAFTEAYFERYGVQPVRNAKVNAQIEQFTKRIPHDVAPALARFYLSHNAQHYVSRAHSVGMMLIDAEKLHTEWARGSKITRLEASGAEKGDAMREQSKRVGKLLGESDETEG